MQLLLHRYVMLKRIHFALKQYVTAYKGTWRNYKTHEVICGLGSMIWKSRNPTPIPTDHTLFWNLELTELENIICYWFLSTWWRYVAISSFTWEKFKPLESATTWSPRLDLYIFEINMIMAFKWAITKTSPTHIQFSWNCVGGPKMRRCIIEGRPSS